LVGAQAWGVFGWPGVCLIGIVLSSVGLSLLWVPKILDPEVLPVEGRRATQ
jgi:hypothetical protein